MEYIDQSASNLLLTIVKGDLDMTQFNILSEEKIQYPDLKIISRIIGGSHIITIQSKDIVLHEIFACISVKDKKPFLLCKPLKDIESNVFLKFENQLNYQFSSSCQTSEEGFNKLQEIEILAKNRKTNNKHGLIFEFPGNNDSAPKTIIYTVLMGKNIEIKTAHSYPNEQKIVFTETKVKLIGGNSEITI
ncbi:MAG: DUF2617 family protein [Candidatus Cloacimonetes bacterium]|nr:DUF2617 family protein [Candidatus Cloacimonadota bacterium]